VGYLPNKLSHRLKILRAGIIFSLKLAQRLLVNFTSSNAPSVFMVSTSKEQPNELRTSSLFWRSLPAAAPGPPEAAPTAPPQGRHHHSGRRRCNFVGRPSLLADFEQSAETRPSNQSSCLDSHSRAFISAEKGLSEDVVWNFGRNCCDLVQLDPSALSDRRPSNRGILSRRPVPQAECKAFNEPKIFS
jgi:hypothetical protein